MQKKTQDRANKETARAITVDWIVITTSVIGLMVVLAASIQAGENGLVSQVAAVF